ncbi:MAG: TIGR03936 family radical SAM-associated protein, partial [Bacteriovoracaceae bacterium]|nr:TIGR03936 family radical SAM-associated protein [Bacteriovoracaceae bacterium]
SRGDRRVADLIYGAWKKGARFDGWNETFKYDLWIQTIEELGLKIEPYLGTIRMDGKLPWSHIDVGLTDRFLEIEWKKALADRSSPACGKPVGYHVHDTNVEAHNRSFEEQKKKLVCFNCGIKCDLQGMISERKEFLTSMQAFKDELYVKPEFKTITERREKRGQNIGFRYRINFSKIGALSFISHLDLQKIVARIFKRAQIEVLYSEGFHERPLFSFGPALSLGISSLSEYFDVRVPVQFADPHALLSILQKYSEAGIYFNKIEEISASSPSIQEAAYAFEFFIPVNNPEKVEEALNVIEKAPQILIKRFSPKKNTYEERDIKPFLGKLTKTCFNMAEPMASLIHEVSPCLNKTGILLTSKVEEGTGVRPSEIREFFESLGLVTEKPIKMDVLIHKAS